MGYFILSDADCVFPLGDHSIPRFWEEQSTICSIDLLSGNRTGGSEFDPAGAAPKNCKRAAFQLCVPCEIGSGIVDAGFCRRFSVTHVSEKNIRNRAVRLECQHHMVDLGLPYRQVVDWIADAMRDFKGHYRDEDGAIVPVPDISSILTPGVGWWMRDMIENGKWQDVSDVPALRREAVERWRLIATTIQIEKASISLCLS